MKKPELLAPAGSMESLKAAICAGCDAVYLSGKKYGARSFATNFDNDELIEAIKLCHLYGIKIYVTVNTLIFEDEVEDFLNYIDFLHVNNVDAIIIQDIGMVDLIRKTYPNLELHASTQMHIHNLEGVKLLEKLNIKRAVLARETSIDTIKKIKNNTNLELEIFVHGALCVSYSGQCLMSYLIGGRSGNRGACAGSCRLPYDVIRENKKLNIGHYPLSMKDLNTLSNIDKLIDLNIDSIKIEGRMKRPEYVYIVVALYRKVIDEYVKTGKINIKEEDIKELKKIFNREFTKGFIFNEENNLIVNEQKPNHQGIEIGKVIDYKNNYATIKLTDDLNINDGIRFIDEKDYGFIVTSMLKNNNKVSCAKAGDIIKIKSENKIKNRTIVVKTSDYNQLNEIKQKISVKRKVNIDCSVYAKIGEKISVTYNDNKNTVTVFGNIVEKSKNYPITKDKIKNQLEKLGDTVYQINKFSIESDENIFINIKELNELRRNLVEKLNEKRIYNIPYLKKEYSVKLPDLKQKQEINLEVLDEKIYDKLKEFDFNKIYSEIENKIFVKKMPRVINEYIEDSNLLLVGELGSINKYKNIETDFSLNVTNSYSVALLHSLGVKKVTLSYEVNESMVNKIYENYVKRYGKEPNLEYIIASRKQAMISKFNLVKKYGNNIYLLDRLKYKYPIIEKNNLMYIYNNKYEYNNILVKINKRIIVDFYSDITQTLIDFIKGVINENR